MPFDPVPAFEAETKRMKNYSLQELAKAVNEARKDQVRVIQMSVWWDVGFRAVTGNNIWLLNKRPDTRNGTRLSSNAPAGKKWVTTKTVYVDGKPVCWCIPVEVITGQKTNVSLNKSNIFDLRTVYEQAMEEPIGISDKEQIKKLVEDYLRENLPEVTARETIDWGEVKNEGDRNSSICYKYLAKIQGKETKIMNQTFTFNAQGKFVSVKDEEGFPKDW